MGASPDGSGFNGLVLIYVVRSEERVDETMADAKKVGATILKPAATEQWFARSKARRLFAHACFRRLSPDVEPPVFKSAQQERGVEQGVGP